MSRKIIAVEIGFKDVTASPNTGTLYAADESFITASSDALANQYFSGRLDGDVGYSIAVSTHFWKGKSSASIGSITVLNHDGGLDAWLNYEFRDKTIVVKQHTKGTSYDSAATLFTAIIENFEVTSERNLRLVIRDPAAALYKPITSSVFSSASPETTPDALGVLKPISFGAPKMCAPVLVNESLLEYHIHDGAVFDVGQVYDQGIPIDFAKTANGFTLLANPSGGLRANPISAGTGDNPVLTADTSSPEDWTLTNQLKSMTARTLDGAPLNDYWFTDANKSRASSDGGKYYFEWVVTDGDTSGPADDNGLVWNMAGGVANAAIVNPQSPKDAGFYVVTGDTALTHGFRSYIDNVQGSFIAAGSPNTIIDDVVGVAIDFDSSPMTIEFYRNNVSMSGPHGLSAATYTPVTGVRGNASAPVPNNTISIQFTSDDTTYDPPAGYDYWADTVATTTFSDLTLSISDRVTVSFDSTSVAVISALAHSSPEVVYTYGYYLDASFTPAQILDAASSSFGGAWFVNRSSDVQFMQLKAPGTSVATINNTQIMADISVKTDYAAGLSDRVGADKNWSPYRESEVGGTATEVFKQQISREYQTEYQSATVMADAYAHAIGNDFPGSLHIDSTAAQTEADRFAALYATERKFWTVPVFLNSTDLGTVLDDIGETYTIKADRFGLDAGVDLVLIGVDASFTDNKLILTLWG